MDSGGTACRLLFRGKKALPRAWSAARRSPERTAATPGEDISKPFPRTVRVRGALPCPQESITRIPVASNLSNPPATQSNFMIDEG
jgi:hypothetical protein